MFRLHRLVIVEIISREGSSSMSEGFLEFIRMLNSISFKELKGNKSIVHILQKNTSLLSFKCLQSITLAMDPQMADSTFDCIITTCCQLLAYATSKCLIM